MNKQDKKGIMNLIKYKKMLGGRRMNLEEAKIKLQELVELGTNLHSDDVWQEAVSIVLAEIDRLQEKNKYMVGRIISLEEDLEYYTNSEEVEE